jgi:hypothetical protein
MRGSAPCPISDSRELNLPSTTDSSIPVSTLAQSPKIVAAALLISFSATIGLGPPV